MRTAIRKHLRDFIAIVVLFVVSIGVASVILSNQRLVLPAWVPVIGKDFFVIKAELSTAQAITPGQGQTVNIAGVEVGEISDVELSNGRGVVTLRLRPEHARVYRDATVLLRPKTGLKDMVAELVPGTEKAGRLEEGDTIPVSNTLPDVNLDEILASLDADTRSFLEILLSAGGQGLRDTGGDLGNTIRRFEPTARDLRRVTEQLSQRRRSLRRVMHNLSLLLDEVGRKDEQVSRFVETSNAVFETLARQDANLRATLRELPSALQATNEGLAKANLLASELGPTLEALRPSARALAPTLRAVRPFVRETTPIIRDELRPFAREAQPTVRELRPAVRDLAAVTPDLDTSFDVLVDTVNTLAYNPPGDQEEGYLFWLSWLNHIGNAIFQVGDAHGPIRRGIVILSCNSIDVLNNVAAVNPTLATLIGLLNAPAHDEVCPATPGVG